MVKHHGRTKGFIISKMIDSKVLSSEHPRNAACDCDIIISRAMAGQLYADLRPNHIESVIVGVETENSAFKSPIEGSLKNFPERGILNETGLALAKISCK